MISHVIIGSAAADLSGGTAYEDKPSRRGQTEREGATRAAALSVERGRGAAHYEQPERAACGPRENVRYESALVAGRRIGLIRGTAKVPVDTNPAQPEFLGAFKALRSLLLGNARFQLRQKSLRRIAQAFHASASTTTATCSRPISAASASAP